MCGSHCLCASYSMFVGLFVQVFVVLSIVVPVCIWVASIVSKWMLVVSVFLNSKDYAIVLVLNMSL